MTVDKSTQRVKLRDSDRAFSGFESLVRVQRNHSEIKGMRTCNTRAIPEPEDLSSDEIELKLRVNNRGVRFTGLQTCKNANCLYCMESVRSAHVRKMAHGIEEAALRGWSAYFTTLTTIATENADLALYRCSKGWEKVRQCLRNHLGNSGIKYHYSRAYDVTFNRDRVGGVYHVHIHAVIMVERFIATDGDDGSAWIHAIISEAWRKQNKHAVAAAQLTERVRTEGMARYMAKWYGIAHEIGNSVKKEGRAAGSMTLIGLMQAAQDNEECATLYRDYSKATRRKRMIQFSGRVRGYGDTWRDLERESPIGPPEWYPWEDPPTEDDPETEEDTMDEDITIPEHWWRTLMPLQDRVSYTIWNGVYIENNGALTDFKAMVALDLFREPRIYDEGWRAIRLKAWLSEYKPWRTALKDSDNIKPTKNTLNQE